MLGNINQVVSSSESWNQAPPDNGGKCRLVWSWSLTLTNVSYHHIIYFCTCYASPVVRSLPGRDSDVGRFILVTFVQMTTRCWFLIHFLLLVVVVYHEIDGSGFQRARAANQCGRESPMKSRTWLFFIVECIMFQIRSKGNSWYHLQSDDVSYFSIIK